MYSELPDHLGGHSNKVHTDEPLLKYLIKKYEIKSMVDVGCGPGWMVNIANQLGLDSMGIEGDYTLNLQPPLFLLHDFTKGKPNLDKNYDLTWTVEFLEHVEEKYIENFMHVFQKTKYICCTAATPIAAGVKWHVNCQWPDYWIKKFEEYGFEYDEQETQNIKEVSGMVKPFIKRNGMFYVNKNL